MGKEFFEKPVHCQKAQIENAISYSGLFSSRTEVNIVFIDKYADSRLRNFSAPNSASDNLMQYATRATAKKTGGDDDDDDEIIPPHEYVEVKITDLIDEISAEFSGQTKNEYDPLPSKENLKKALVNLEKLNDGGCGEFLNAVLNNMNIRRKINKKKTDIDTVEKLFDYITDTEKIDFVQAKSIKRSKVYLGEKPQPAAGLNDDGDGNIVLRSSPKTSDSKTKYLYQMNRIHRMIHEMLHRVKQSHEKMYKAGFDALSTKEQENFVPSGDASTDFTVIMNQKCGFNPDDPDEVKAYLVQ